MQPGGVELAGEFSGLGYNGVRYRGVGYIGVGFSGVVYNGVECSGGARSAAGWLILIPKGIKGEMRW